MTVIRCVKRFIKQNVCKLKPRINFIMNVQEMVGDLKLRYPRRGEVEYLWNV